MRQSATRRGAAPPTGTCFRARRRRTLPDYGARSARGDSPCCRPLVSAARPAGSDSSSCGLRRHRPCRRGSVSCSPAHASSRKRVPLVERGGLALRYMSTNRRRNQEYEYRRVDGKQQRACPVPRVGEEDSAIEQHQHKPCCSPSQNDGDYPRRHQQNSDDRARVVDVPKRRRKNKGCHRQDDKGLQSDPLAELLACPTIPHDRTQQTMDLQAVKARALLSRSEPSICCWSTWSAGPACRPHR